MHNLEIKVQLEDGSVVPFDFQNGKELIVSWFSDDWKPGCKGLTLEATGPDGTKVQLTINYD